MALNVELLRREAQGAMWVSPARVCLTAEGRLVNCEDVTAVKLLVGEGGSLPVAEAERYGLVAHPVADPHDVSPVAIVNTGVTLDGRADLDFTELVVALASPVEHEAEEKAQEPPEDKQIVAPENKRRRVSRKK